VADSDVTRSDESLDEYEGHPVLDESGPVDRYSPLLVAAIAALAIIGSLQLGLGEISDPGPGLWPMSVAVVALVLAPAIALFGHRFDVPSRAGLRRIFWLLAGLCLFLMAYPFIGFVGAGFLMVLPVMRFSAEEKWATAIITAVAAPAVAYIVFALALGVNLRLF
jgi:putative tricarboxylic transport membrane protein